MSHIFYDCLDHRAPEQNVYLRFDSNTMMTSRVTIDSSSLRVEKGQQAPIKTPLDKSCDLPWHMSIPKVHLEFLKTLRRGSYVMFQISSLMATQFNDVLLMMLKVPN